MKSAEPSTRTSKRSRGEASSTAPTSGAMPATEEVHVDPTTVVDPFSDDDAVDLIVTPPFSLRAMMNSFMTTQEAHGQLLNELLTEVATLKVDFAKYRSVFPPPPSSND